MQKSFLHKFLIEPSPQRQARSIAWGAFIAFSPFVGFHTIMTAIAAYLFNLNFTLTLLVSCSINNPWSMIPIYASGYLFGQSLFSYYYTPEQMPTNPAWMNKIEHFCISTLGIHTPSLWPFLVGGTILGTIVAVLLYGLLYFFHYRSTKKTSQNQVHQDKIS